MILKSEKGVTLISLLTYIAVLLTVMIIIGRITGIFNRNLNSVDSATKRNVRKFRRSPLCRVGGACLAV